MAQNETWLNHDLLDAVKVQYLDGNLFSMDNAGNMIGVKLTRDGVDYSGGGSVSANVIRSDGGTVVVAGALSGNAATVVLPQAAYAVPGVVSIIVKLTVSGEVTTIAAVVANVYKSSTDSAIDPGTIIPSVQTLIAAIDAAVASIPADYSSLWTSLAPAFSTSVNYTAGQYVTYNGALYRFTVDHPAGAWNSAHVVASNIGSDLNSLKSAISEYVDVTGNKTSNLLPFLTSIKEKNGVILEYSNGTIKYNGTCNASGNSGKIIEFPLAAGQYGVTFENFPTTVYVTDSNAHSDVAVCNTSAYKYLTFTLNSDTNININTAIAENTTYNSIAKITIFEYTGSAQNWEKPVDTAKDDVAREKINTISENVISVEESNAVFEKIEGGYVNATRNPPVISPLNSYWYSDIYELQKGDTVTVTSKDPSGSVVARISKWNSDGSTCLGVIETGTTSNTTVSYTASELVEYLRFSGNISENFICKLKELIIPTNFENATGRIVEEDLNAGYAKNIVKNIADEEINSNYGKGIIKSVVKDTVIDPYELSIAMFDDIAVCGDSYTVGEIYDGSSLQGRFTKTSWGKVLGRLNGIDVTIYAQGGTTTETFLTRSSCLPALLNDSPHELYIIALGINDYNNITLGTIADIKDDYTQNPNTFYGNYGKIIAQIKNHAPNAKIIISKVFIPTLYSGVFYNYSSTAIQEIANKFQIAYIDTKNNDFLCSTLYTNDIMAHSGHPTAPTYSGIAVAMTGLLSRCIKENLSYFTTYLPPT